MRKNKLTMLRSVKRFLFFCIGIIGSLNNINDAFAGRYNQWKHHEDQWNLHKGKNHSEKPYERRRQRQNRIAIEKFTQQQQAKIPTTLQFYPQANIEDSQYQIFILMFLMSTYTLQANAAHHNADPCYSNPENSPNQSMHRQHLVHNITLAAHPYKELGPHLSLSSAFLSSSHSKVNFGPDCSSNNPVCITLPKEARQKVSKKSKTKKITKEQMKSASAFHTKPLYHLEQSNTTKEALTASPLVRVHTLAKNGGINLVHEFARNQTCPSLQLLVQEALQVDCTDPYFGFDSKSDKQKKCLDSAPTITEAGLIFAKDIFNAKYESEGAKKNLGVIVGEYHDSLHHYLYESLIIKISAVFGVKNLVLEITPQDFATIRSSQLDPLFPITVSSDIWQYNIRKIRLALSLGMKVIPADLPMPNLLATLSMLLYKKHSEPSNDSCDYEKLVFEEREPFFCRGMLEANEKFLAIFGAAHTSFIDDGCPELESQLYYIQLERKKAYKLISLTSNCPDSLFKRAGQQVHFRYKKPYREMPIEEIVTRRRIFSEYKYISVEDIIDELANE